MNKRKLIVKICLVSILLVVLITGVTEIKTYVKAEEKISDIMNLSGITRDTSGTPIARKKYVTREEFAQMIVQASPYSEEVTNTNKIKLFKDVSKKSKKAVYIQIAVSKGYMSGYIGGLFKPKKEITLKEAIYGTLEVLGYTAKDFTGNLSDARYDKFKVLGLSKDITRKQSDKLTKNDCETLFYNLLNAKQSTGEIYAKTLGYSLNGDGKIDYTTMLDKKLKGPYLTKDGWEKILSRKLSSYSFILNNKKISYSNIENGSIVYYSENANRIWVYDEKVYGTLENITYNQALPQEFTVSGTNYTVENSQKMNDQLKEADMKKGNLVVLLLSRDNKVAKVLPIKSVIANSSWQKQISFDSKKGTIYKNDKNAASSDVKSCDLIYYCKELNRVWAYDQKVFGSLDSITYNQGDPQELTVAGTNYTVENAKEMKNELKAASIQSGMPVVIVIGWEDKVSMILPLTSRVAGGNWQQELSFDVSQGTIYKNGSKVTVADVESTDVIYYSKELQTLWVYAKRVYGVLKTISPNLSTPSQIVVAGTTYDLKLLPINSSGNSTDNPAENAWGKRLRENGIQEGDSVVVLFGYNGKVADIYTDERMPITIAGYVLEVKNNLVKETNNENSVKQVISIVDTEGVIREFPCTDNSIIKGSVVEVNFQDNKSVIKKIDSDLYMKNSSYITVKKVAAAARIIAVKDQNFKSLSVAELKEINWSAGNMLYCRLNTSGEITDLILNYVPDTFYQYGLLKKIVLDESSGYFELTFDLGGTETTIVTNDPKGNVAFGPVAVQIEDNKIKDLISLKGVGLAYISGKQANAEDSVYRITDDVVVYFYKNGEYYKGSLEDITDCSKYTVKGYMDEMQGAIHVIVVTY